MKPSNPKTIAIVTSVALALGSGALWIQHLRHGWPFSLNHGLGQNSGPASPVAFANGSGAPAHPRAELEWDIATLDAIGVRVEPVRRETLAQPLRAVATVVPDESRLSHVHTRVAGWIEQLYVNTTGESVRAGQPLATIFSQELFSSQSEYLAARRSATSDLRSSLVDGARARLKVLGMTEAEISAIEASGEALRLVTVVAPRSGIVLHRGISVGTAVDPATEILTVADLSQVWVLAEIAEADIPDIKVGMAAELEFSAAEREPIKANVSFISPTMTERTRTLRVRFAVTNRSGSLRPGLYGSASFQISPRDVLSVPRDAVVDTGENQHVFVVIDGRRLVPRPVRLGLRFEERVEVREGLKEGDSIVASGVFLIDSESRLQASGGGSDHGHGGKQDNADTGTTDSVKTDSEATDPGAAGEDHKRHADPKPVDSGP